MACTCTFFHTEIKVRKEANIRKRRNQVPHLTQDTTWESNKHTINITNKSKEATPPPHPHTHTHTSRRPQGSNEQTPQILSTRNTRLRKTQTTHEWNTKSAFQQQQWNYKTSSDKISYSLPKLTLDWLIFAKIFVIFVRFRRVLRPWSRFYREYEVMSLG